MKKIHNQLRKDLRWYADWHNHRHHGKTHWAILMVFAIFCASVSIALVREAGVDVGVNAVAQAGKGGGKYQELATLTNKVLASSVAYNRADNANKRIFESELMSAIQARKQAILAAVETDPRSVLAIVMPEEAKENLPQKAKDALETEVTVDGEYTFYHGDDFDNSTAFYDHIFKSKGKEYKLFFVDGMDMPKANPESTVRVKGFAIDKKIVVPAKSDFTVLSQGQVLGTGTSVTKKIAVIPFNFTNNTSQPWSVDYMKTTAFTGARSSHIYYNENSYGKWGLAGASSVDGDVYNWVTIPLAADGTCPYYNYASAAESAAKAQGFTFTNYTNVVYAFPSSGTGCNWSGMGNVGGPRSWVTSFTLRTVSHELGHNFSFHHANTYNCYENGVRVSVGGSCSSTEYGDPFSIMGASQQYHHNNYHKGRLWMTSSNIETVSGSGTNTYTIMPSETASSGVQALRVAKDRDANGNPTNYYLLEVRQPYGLDAFSTTSPVAQGISIRMVPEFNISTQPQLLDMTPETTDFSDAALPVGRTFTDSKAGVTITPLSVSTAGAQVEISVSGPTCGRANPTVTLSPANQWAPAGASVTYSLTVKNNDQYCGTSTFAVTPNLPSGFTQTPSSLSFTLNSGTQSTQNVTLTSSQSIPQGAYQFSETASANGYSGSAWANYNVNPPDTTPPVVTISSPATGSTLSTKGSTTISATASDASGISKIEIYIDNNLYTTCSNVTSCSYRWSMSGVVAGTHTILAKAFDKDLVPNSNYATSTVTVQSGGGNGNGGGRKN
jgi:hypothetical protein